MISFQQIQDNLSFRKGETTEPGHPVLQLLYDSRLISNGFGGIFFALKSGRNDGHRFIPKVAEKGVSQWIISDPEWADWLEKRGNQNWLLVDNVLDALRKVAAWHRTQFQLPVIGITGSNGKTIVKEWLTQLVGHDRFICKSPKSFNSQLGVALSVWNLTARHNLGVFEAGISREGEMAELQNMIQPELGILTNLATAHDEGFGSRESKFREKLLLFTGSHTLILSESLRNLHQNLISEILPDSHTASWSWGNSQQDGIFHLVFDGKTHPFFLPFRDKASLENLGNALAMAIHLGISPGILQNRLHLINQPEMRLSLKEGVNGNILIDDSYTNDVTGLEAALQFAVLQQKSTQELVVILSDLEESSESLEQAKEKIIRLADNFQVNRIITLGHQFEGIHFPARCHPRNFANVDDMLDTPGISAIQNSVILIKGARKFGLEALVKSWQKKIHGTRLEINLDAMVHNLNFYRSQLAPETGVMAMVKALGYGSGDEEVARILEFHNITYLAVAYPDEGVKLREAGITTPIMVMNPTEDSLPVLVANQLEPEIYSRLILKAFIAEIGKSDSVLWPAVHIKVDTGMHRLGFLPEELEEVVYLLNQVPELTIATVFSHLAGADEDALNEYSRLQILKFEAFCEGLSAGTGKSFKKHILNSAGILRFPEAQYDMVRLGIGLYGIEVNSWYQNQLRPVSTLKTTVSQIKNVAKGESVGYGRKTILSRNSRIATIAIGYSDGFRRDFSQGKASVKFGDVWVPVVGNVCMDMCMVDVTDTPIKEGDESIIFDDADSLLQLAIAAETIPYEILTGIGHRVKRIFFRE
ncbi:MAG TPA: bifunctional UDP-N-acetylmuramoyl-tripeptide:D-alanyl-D-alanine ligase/alanine racemase [Catalimonadaceae bacterium]|nr:bifunctional UDP-N-acetylmuramoyl-tripeptide:D-alanyl-D-alanine ligase/alanine racemase [Catalimonadaceae bacterium]